MIPQNISSQWTEFKKCSPWLDTGKKEHNLEAKSAIEVNHDSWGAIL